MDMLKKSKKPSKKKVTPKPIVIKLTKKHKQQARESIRKHGVAKFEIQDVRAVRSVPARLSTSTVHNR
jgi:hypothetical protein